jgi:hypothetical protein
MLDKVVIRTTNCIESAWPGMILDYRVTRRGFIEFSAGAPR